MNDVLLAGRRTTTTAWKSMFPPANGLNCVVCIIHFLGLPATADLAAFFFVVF